MTLPIVMESPAPKALSTRTMAMSISVISFEFSPGKADPWCS